MNNGLSTLWINFKKIIASIFRAVLFLIYILIFPLLAVLNILTRILFLVLRLALSYEKKETLIFYLVNSLGYKIPTWRKELSHEQGGNRSVFITHIVLVEEVKERKKRWMIR